MDFDCEKVDRWLEAYRDGELGVGPGRRVEAHLGRCPSCTARLAEIQAVGFELAESFLHEATRPARTKRLAEEVSRRIAEMGPPRAPDLWQRLAESSRFPVSIRLPAAAAAAAVAIYLLVLMGSRVFHPQGQPPTQTALTRPPVRVHAIDPTVKVSVVDDREPEWTVVWISTAGDGEGR